MKKLILYVLVSFFTVKAMSQEKYIAVQVFGKVVKADGSKIVKGTVLMDKDKLLFPSTGGGVLLLHPTKGRLMVKPSKKDQKGNTFIVFLKEYIQLNATWIKLSSKSG